MAWRKSPPELIAAFQKALPADPRAERRTMFGYPCCFVNGNMFTGLHQETMMIRLPGDARAELLRVPGAAIFEPIPGRPMKEYVNLPPAILGDPSALAQWIGRSFAYAASLPEKPPKTAARKAQSPRPRRGPVRSGERTP